MMLPPSSPSTLLTIKGKEYAPEDFWLDWKTVYTYREKIFSSDEELASWRVEESDGLFLYARNKKYDSTGKENGWWYFSQVPGDGNYNTYITEEEKKLFGNESILKLLAKYDVFIEYGPWIGDANKLRKRVLENRQFAHFRKKVRGVIRHLWLDASTYTADQFNKEYQNNTTIHGECIPTEWSKSSIPKDIPNAAHVMLWWTPGAYSREQLIQLIRSMWSGSHVHKSPLLLSFFSAPQEPDKKLKIEQIKDAYRCDAAKNFVMKWIEALGVPIDNCEYVVDYQEWSWITSDRIRVWAKLKKNITVDVWWWKQMTKKAWECIRAVSSRRYTDEQFTDILKEAWTTWVKLHGEWGIKVAQSYLPRKKFSHKVKKRARNIAWTLVWWALLLWWAHEYGKYSKLRDARAYALQEIAYKNIRYPLTWNSSYYQLSDVVNDNLAIESREQRLDFITNHIYDIAITEYRNYPFPDEEFVKAAIMRYIPENIDYFTHSKWPDEYFLSFVHHVLMPHLFSFFGNWEGAWLYDWTKEKDIATLLHNARKSTNEFEIDKFTVDWLGWDTSWVAQTYDLTDLWYVYMVDVKGMLKMVRLWYVTMLHHEWYKTKQWDRILIAWTEEDWFSAATAREFLTFVDEKWYASLLTDKIMYVLDPVQVSEEYDVVKKQIRNYILELNRTWYDLSRLCRGDKDSEIKKLIVWFLANQSAELHESIAWIV